MQTIIETVITHQVHVSVIYERNEYQVRIHGLQFDPRIDRDYSVYGIYRSEMEALRSYVPLCKELNQRVA